MNKLKLLKNIITIFVFAIVFVVMNITHSRAATQKDNEVDYKIDFGEKIASTDMEIEFDSSKLQFVKPITNNIKYNQIESGRIIIAYADESGVGTDNIVLRFKAKTTKEKYNITVYNINAYSLEKDEEYVKSKLTVKPLDTKVNENSAEYQAKTKNSLSELPYTGNSIIKIIGIVLAILAVIGIIVFAKFSIKYKNILPIFIAGIVFLGSLSVGTNSKAYNNILIQKFYGIKDCGNIITIVPNKIYRYMIKNDLLDKLIEENVNIGKVVDKNGNEIEDEDLIGNGSKVIIEDGVELNSLVYGDINGDGNVNSHDVGLIIKEKVKNERITGIQRKAANLVNENDQDDKTLDSKDIERFEEYIIQRLGTRIVDELPLGSSKEIKVEDIHTFLENSVINKGTSTQVEFEVTPENATRAVLEWESSNNDVATVDSNGIITGVSGGAATITVKTTDGSEIYKSIPIEVYAPVEGLELNLDYIELEAEDMASIQATVTPEDATNKNVIWSSEDENIATVDKNGLVTAVSEGTTNITAKTEDGELVQQTMVEVNVSIKEISLSTYSLYMTKGTSQVIDAVLIPDNAKNENITWLSSDTSVATVDINGKVTGIKKGFCIVRAEGQNETVMADCTVEVLDPDEEAILAERLELSSDYIELDVNDKAMLIATITPNNTTNKKVNWSSSNPEVVTVDANGIVTAKKEGEAQITATTVDGSDLSLTSTIKVTVPVEEIHLNSYELNLKIGDRQNLVATITPEDATNKNLTWISSNNDIAYVDRNGFVTANGLGECTVTVQSDNGIVAECAVNVEEVINEAILATNLELDKQNINLKKGETERIQANITPDNTTNKRLIWSSNNTDVAIVSGEGVVTARGEGTATISATTTDGSNLQQNVEVNVTVPVTKIAINPGSISLIKEETQKLQEIITPSDATNKSVSWASSDENIVTVDNSGNILAKNVGEAYITATALDGSNVSESAKIIVREEESTDILVSGIVFNSNSLSIDKGENETIQVAIIPSNATNKELNWTSSNENIVEVDDNGNIVAKQDGTATVTAMSTDGSEVSGSTTITVTIPAESITLNKSAETLDLSGTKTTQLVATIEPGNVSNNSIQWISSNTSIATVDENGKVTAIANGTVTITAKTANGKTADCTITVNTSATGVTLNKSTETLDLSGTKTSQLTATVLPVTATDKSVTWTSSNPEVATVDTSGKVTAIANGTATITVTTANGNTETCSITIGTNPTSISLDITSKTLDLSGTKTTQLVATIQPSTITNKTVTWSSSNSNVATVSSSGYVTGIANGTATITAKTANGKTATCSITVQTNPTVIKMKDHKGKYEDPDCFVHITQTADFTSVIEPSTANVNTAVTWTSSNTNIAKVSNGKITPVSNGTVTITAKTANGKQVSRTVHIRSTILFIGNSKTYYNKMYDIFKGLATTAGKNVKVVSATNGGKSLKWHYDNNNNARKAIDDKTYLYDYVILQESTAASKADTVYGAKGLVNLIKKRNPNIRVIYNAVWQLADLDINELYNSNMRYIAAKEETDKITSTKAKIARVGSVFAKRKAEYGSQWKIDNWFVKEKERKHPTCRGSYLEACCLYNAVFNASPEGIAFYKAWDQKNNHQEVTISTSVATSLQKYSANYWNKTLSQLGLK